MNLKNPIIYISLTAFLITLPISICADTTPAVPQSVPCAPCDCTPKPHHYSIKAALCAFHILKLGLIVPAARLTVRHLKDTCEELLAQDDEFYKAYFYGTNAAATIYFIYALLQTSYEGIKHELFDDNNQKLMENPL